MIVNRYGYSPITNSFDREVNMNQAQTSLIKSTWQQVVPIAGEAARLFYRRLFEIDPALAAHFDGIDMDRQRERLIGALSAVVDGLDVSEAMIPQLEALGRRHAGYGAKPGDYDSVGAALLWTLRQGLGDAWSAAAESAWREAYGRVSAVMQAAAADQARLAGLAEAYRPRTGFKPGFLI